jgi:hypothetical protein
LSRWRISTGADSERQPHAGRRRVWGFRGDQGRQNILRLRVLAGTKTTCWRFLPSPASAAAPTPGDPRGFA